MVNRSNSSFFLKALGTVIICFLLSITTSAQSNRQDPEDFGTNIALLFIKTGETVVYQDPYFELLDLGDYLLIPVNRLASQLDLGVSYQRSEDKIVLTNNLTQKQAEIYLEDKIYRIDGQSLVSNQSPLFLARDFYVSIPFLEFFLEADINWDFRFQALTINVKEGLFKDRSTTMGPEKSAPGTSTESPPQKGPPFALSSIRYKFGLEHREEEECPETLDGFFKLRLDGYAGEWAVSAAGIADYDFYDHSLTPDLPLLRAKYHKDDELIIIGNAELDLEKTIGKKELWGVHYMTPDYQDQNKLIAYTDVSGVAATGDQVLLYVNDRLWQTAQPNPDGNYLFANVPLKVNRVNQIRVVIQTADGETSETTQAVAASPRIMKQAGNELLVASGLYKQKELDEWQGAMVGYRQKTALSENTTYNQETTIFVPYNQYPDQGYIGSDTGVAFRLNKNLICTLDWLIGGEVQTDVKTGFESSLLYCLEKGYFEGIISYLPATVTQGVDSRPGQGVTILSEHELTSDLTFNTKGYTTKSTPESHPWTLDGANLMLTKRFGKHSQNSLAGGIGKEWMTRKVQTGTLEADETSATIKYIRREKIVGTKAEAEFVDTAYLLNDNDPYRLQNLNTKSDLTVSIARNFLFGVAFDTENTWREKTYTALSLLGETDAKWSITDDTLLIGNVKLEGSKKTDSSFQIEQFKTGLYLHHFFTPHLNVFAEANRVSELPFYTQDENYLYTTARLGLTYHVPDRTGKFSGQLGYRSPVGSRMVPQWSSVFTYEKELSSAFLLELAFERHYDTLWDQDPEHVIRFSIGRALGFADGKIKPYRYSEEDDTTRIGGKVYLDINGNGQFDADDQPLDGIKILVDGRIAETNQDGEYIFSSLPPGIYRVYFHLPSLPANYTPVTEPQLIRLREQENFFVDFAVTVNGSISGKVFIDANANGRQDGNESPLPWIGVILDEGQQKVFTDSDGSFYFEGVALGAHTVTLDPQSLPTGLTITGYEVKTVFLTEEALDYPGLQFPLIAN